MTDEPEETESPEAALAALAALARCDTPRDAADWLVHHALETTGADAAFCWTLDVRHGSFQCSGAAGEGATVRGRAALPRETGALHEILRDREALSFGQAELLASNDPLLAPTPMDAAICGLFPVLDGDAVAGVLALFFRDPEALHEAEGTALEAVEFAAPVLGRTGRAAKKTAGMLHAIERLTNLYDASKTFGATIDWDELTVLVARKAADLASAEIASLWLIDKDAEDVVLGSTSTNHSYDIANPPEAVGASIIGDLLARQETLCENEVGADEPLRGENSGYDVRSVLAVPLEEDGSPIGALVLVNKRGRSPEFSTADVELIEDLGRQAVRALHNARIYEAEKKVEELDALLAVSREITATLDLDRVMHTVVNASSALIRFDRCAVAILQKGKLTVGAVSGMATIDRGDPSIRRTSEILEWAFHAGHDLDVRREDGEILSERPETVEKFRRFFDESGMNSFHASILQDEEGKLGILAFESEEPVIFGDETTDLIQIVSNQATVAMRNAQLYTHVPLSGFWKPLAGARRRLAALPRGRRVVWSASAAIAALALVAIPWHLRLEGPARILPARTITVTASVEGKIDSVRRHEGDRVAAGDLLAVLTDEATRAALAAAEADEAISESEMARRRAAGDAAGEFQAQARRDEARSRIALARAQLAGAHLTAPRSGVIVTPRLQEKAGHLISPGEEFCTIADTTSADAEIEVPEVDASRLAPGQEAAIKLNAYPTRVFHGTVSRLGAVVRPSAGGGEQRVLVAEARIPNPDGALRPGMAGDGKVSAGTVRLATAIFRRPARWIWSRLWHMLP